MGLVNSVLGRNITFVRPPYFILTGFSGIPHMNYYYVFLFFVYIVSVLRNTAVMAVILLDQNLRTPKYVAVFNLAWTDLLGSTAQVPKVLDIFLFNHHIISYNDCMTFLFFCYMCLSMQALNLVVLSYDRLVVITFPLHYHMKVTHRFMFSLIAKKVKAFKTCSAHLSLVAIYFLPVLMTFTFNRYIDSNGRIINLSLTSVIPPTLNPFVYVLQTQEIKKSVTRLLKIKCLRTN
ncbi:LOW QUALITY PROTEIN: olfactory receptor 52E4-like [Thalassophryne amazonica]|uniref:LOW QUALITY PROTEIN: olfactory receptor 52E4-like n=1 Tax=Thalassophryne amazonica TaxID=390379 RepID=UPI00147151EE|nr:LOW QUALITY PROTEIN: olfactory receptor 52E4-like [Thalassophryne amazonica]